MTTTTAPRGTPSAARVSSRETRGASGGGTGGWTTTVRAPAKTLATVAAVALLFATTTSGGDQEAQRSCRLSPANPCTKCAKTTSCDRIAGARSACDQDE